MPRRATGQIDGLAQCREGLKDLSRAVQGGVGKRSLTRAAKVFVALTQSKIRVSRRAPSPSRQPGALKAAPKVVDARVKKGAVRLAILVDDPAAVENEYGTHKMKAQPFFRPAIEEGRQAAADAMADALRSETDAAIARAAARAAKK